MRSGAPRMAREYMMRVSTLSIGHARMSPFACLNALSSRPSAGPRRRT